MFKAICSIMERRIPACSELSITTEIYNETAINATVLNETLIIEQSTAMAEAADAKLEGLDKRA